MEHPNPLFHREMLTTCLSTPSAQGSSAGITAGHPSCCSHFYPPSDLPLVVFPTDARVPELFPSPRHPSDAHDIIVNFGGTSGACYATPYPLLILISVTLFQCCSYLGIRPVSGMGAPLCLRLLSIMVGFGWWSCGHPGCPNCSALPGPRSDEVVAVASMNYDPIVSKVAEVLAAGRTIRKRDVE